MPIIIKVNPIRVEEIEIQANSEVLENVLLSTWPIVRKHLKKLNHDLKKRAVEFINSESDLS